MLKFLHSSRVIGFVSEKKHTKVLAALPSQNTFMAVCQLLRGWGMCKVIIGSSGRKNASPGMR